MFGEITKEKADEMFAAWDVASVAERLTMDRVNWITMDTTTTYYVTRPSVVSQFEKSERSANLDSDVEPARVAREEIVLRVRSDAFKGRSCFVVDPASGALIVHPDLDLVMTQAFSAHVRSVSYRLYLLQARLYLEALWLKSLRAGDRIVGYLNGSL